MTSLHRASCGLIAGGVFALAMFSTPATAGGELGRPFSWTGFYLGAHLGGGASRQQWTVDDPPCLDPNVCITHNSGSNNALGFIGGGQIGFNYQHGRWVWGLEAEYSAASMKGDHQNTRAFGFQGPGLGDFETDVTAGRFLTT